MEKMLLRKMYAPDGGGNAGGGQAAPSAQGAGEGQQQGGQANGKPSFDDLIRGDYKQDYEAKVKAAIDARFKNQKDLTKELGRYQPIMQALGQKYGRDAGDVEGISKLLTDDDSLYQDAADQAGVPIATYKEMLRLRSENERITAEQRQSAEEMQMRAHYQTLAEQSEKMKAVYPDFDLIREMQNPVFARLTAPGTGISVENAFFAVHHDEIQKASMQYAGQRAAQAVAASVQANGLRPQENGTGGAAMNVISNDPGKWDRRTVQDIMRRVQNGEKITL